VSRSSEKVDTESVEKFVWFGPGKRGICGSSSRGDHEVAKDGRDVLQGERPSYAVGERVKDFVELSVEVSESGDTVFRCRVLSRL